ncbi:MAG: hypothetical protein V4653_17850, partial [Pseudomonadota bacterium]
MSLGRHHPGRVRLAQRFAARFRAFAALLGAGAFACLIGAGPTAAQTSASGDAAFASLSRPAGLTRPINMVVDPLAAAPALRLPPGAAIPSLRAAAAPPWA